jgi:hypothetical protein
MKRKAPFLCALFLSAIICRAEGPLRPQDYFAIQVVDDQTGRGVPMVELKTTSCLDYYTDSAGYIAFYEPGLMDRTVWFDVASHGYEFPKDMFGQSGVKLKTTPGTKAVLKIKRINIAERLYRATGEGIYRDSILLGLKPPIDEPLLNAEVTGQDSVLNAIYRGKLYWFYGDTLRVSYALGNYSTTGATTDLPGKIDPSAGFALHYLANKDGFTKPMAPMQSEGVVWLSGMVAFPADDGTNMLAFYDRRRGLGEILENGFVRFDPSQEQFFKTEKAVPLHPLIRPQGQPLRAKGQDGVMYIYFAEPYPNVRVRDDMASYLDLKSYEGYTCLKPGSREVDRDTAGKLRWSWRKNTPPLSPKEQEDLIKAGKIRRNEMPCRLEDANSGKAIQLNNSSCEWNDYRKRYVMIASQEMGATMLGEVWYAEADRPEGPWVRAHKIITHANKPHDAHDFYNPSHHAFFDRQGGRVIYLEGSYVNTFSGNHQTTPLYEYNQIMYRLDLADPRLK